MPLYKKHIKKIILTALVILFAASAITEPLLINNKKENWSEESKAISFRQAQAIQEAINFKSSLLLNVVKSIKNRLAEKNIVTQKDVFKEVLAEDFKSYFIQISNENYKTIVWNNEPIFPSDELYKRKDFLAQTFFKKLKLKEFISVVEKISFGNNIFWIAVSIPINERLLPTKANLEKISFLDSLRQEYKTDFQFEYEAGQKNKLDGRYYSSPILNNYKNKIAVVTFLNPALDFSIASLKDIIWKTQSVIIFLIAILLLIELIKFVSKITSRLKRFLIFAALILLIRVLLFVLEIPSGWFNNTLTDASNFSSRFGFGIVRSPLEFFITALSFLSISLIGYKFITEYFKERNSSTTKKWILNLAASTASMFLYFLLWRGFGAAIRSVVFDSTIRYFKEFSLIPSASVFLMCINILLLGLIIFISSIVLLAFVYKILSHKIDFGNYRWLAILFIALQILGFAFDQFQPLPQGTSLIRIVFITLTVVALFIIINDKYTQLQKYFAYAFISSIISVSLLTYYNSELEKESLKNSAYDLMRVNENQIQFILYQALSEAGNNNDLFDALNRKVELSSVAFSIWSKSLLYKEGIAANISIYDKEKNIVGSFSSLDKSNSKNEVELNQGDGIQISSKQSIYGEENQLIGTLPINYEENNLGFLVIETVVSKNIFNYQKITKLLISERVGILSAVDYDNLNIYEFENNELVRSSNKNVISKELVAEINSLNFNKANEAWLETKINDENNLLFIAKQKDAANEKLLVVSREIKNFTWNLSDFFKIFFIHTSAIFVFALAWWLINLKSYSLNPAFRTKLITAFLFISIVPLFLIAAYVRNLTEEKNNSALSRMLFEKINQIKNYSIPYLESGKFDERIIFENASRELTTKFSVYDEQKEIYSSNQSLYDAGVLGGKINSEAYYELIMSSNNLYYGKEKVQNVSVNSAFGKMVVNDKEYFIEVNDLFNRTIQPMSELQLDVFLFGVFSFALLMIVGVSTILSAQISAPINKLTNATRAISSGDLNTEVTIKSSGELGELANGFNMMVERIRQSQVEIAQFEREEAWREMAKQVAHEIKNPLTPMKLSVQQLITAYEDKSPKFNSIFEKVTATIISQIETLKNIASEFSNFARMPRANQELLNLIPVIEEVVNLYADKKNPVKLNTRLQEAFITADSDHIKRTIVNLIRNSFQAKASKIIVAVNYDLENYKIDVEDNGNGIPEDAITKIFDENYTTKKSGMGLGLSMAKKYIESINGNIYVATTNSNGTTFTITIPKAK